MCVCVFVFVLVSVHPLVMCVYVRVCAFVCVLCVCLRVRILVFLCLHVGLCVCVGVALLCFVSVSSTLPQQLFLHLPQLRINTSCVLPQQLRFASTVPQHLFFCRNVASTTPARRPLTTQTAVSRRKQCPGLTDGVGRHHAQAATTDAHHEQWLERERASVEETVERESEAPREIHAHSNTDTITCIHTETRANNRTPISVTTTTTTTTTTRVLAQACPCFRCVASRDAGL